MQKREVTGLPPDAVVVDRDVVESTAFIIGRSGSSAEALREADAHDGQVRFWYSSKTSSVFLEKLPKEE